MCAGDLFLLRASRGNRSMPVKLCGSQTICQDVRGSLAECKRCRAIASVMRVRAAISSGEDTGEGCGVRFVWLQIGTERKRQAPLGLIWDG